MIVLLHHWIPDAYQPVHHLGRLGVLLFFVLSGYLITGILLRCRKLVRSGVESPGFALRQFYSRRFLRIFPVYYGILIAGWLLHWRFIRETILWDTTYTSNVYFAIRGEWQNPISHLWSLSVEEQFYLVWPALILWIPRRFLPATIIGLILMAPVFRGIGSLAGLNPVADWVLSPACLDTLGAGAFLALAQFSPDLVPHWMRGKVGWLPWIGLPLLVGMMSYNWIEGDTPLYRALYDSGAALVAVYFVARASSGIPGLFGKALEWRPIAYLGRISYGVYLFHLFVSGAVYGFLKHIGVSHEPRYLLPLLMSYFAATLILASLSWHFLEAPLNDLKRYFPYRMPRREVSVTSSRSGPE